MYIINTSSKSIFWGSLGSTSRSDPQPSPATPLTEVSSASPEHHGRLQAFNQGNQYHFNLGCEKSRGTNTVKR